MPDSIDHAAEAREFLARARAGQNNILAELGDDESELGAEDLMLAQEGVSAAAAQAQAHATLALAAAQDRANELKRIEILVALSRVECENVSTPTDALDTLYSRHGNGVSEPQVLRTRPSIARSLGLGGESDGE